MPPPPPTPRAGDTTTDRHPHPINTRAVPANRDAEQAVLATLIYAPENHHTLTPELDTTDFYWPHHATIWDTWHHLHTTTGTPPDPITLHATLTNNGHPDAAALIPTLAGTPASPLNATHHAKLVRDHARLRIVQDLGTGLLQLAANPTAADHIETHLAEALQRLDDTAMRFGATHTTSTTGLKDLTWILNGQPPQIPPPTICRRTDGTGLFYTGKVNGVFGDPECAKTWLAQTAGVEALNDGGTLAMIDVDHNGPDHTAARLLLLGAHPHHLADTQHFRYYEPDDPDQLRAAVTDITTWAPTVTIIDSLGEIFPMLGVNTNDGDDMTTAMRDICTRPAVAGSCVITIDHLPKSSDARATGFAIGTIAKKRMIRGTYLRAEARQKPVPGQIGRINLRIEKDTAGELRKTSGSSYAGTFTLDSTQPHTTTWTITHDLLPTNNDGTFRPTNYMEKVANYVQQHDGCTQNDIETNIPGTARHIRAALQILVYEEHITRIPGPRRSWLHTLTHPYQETHDPHLHPPT